VTRPPKTLKIGTRGSALALRQAELVRDLLLNAHPDTLIASKIEIVVIKTTGDKVLDRPLSEIGGKGLFTKEIEEALLAGEVHLAVHSMKDVATRLPDGLVIPCMLEREDARDAFISNDFPTFESLPEGAMVGTASLRRKSQLLHLRPDLKIIPLRGNVQTRLAKLARGELQAIVLAVAGLNRLDMRSRITQYLPPETMLPAVAQGAIGVQMRSGDAEMSALLAPLSHTPTFLAVTAERAFLAALDGNCTTPIAAHAVHSWELTTLTGLLASEDGKELVRIEQVGMSEDAYTLGTEAGAQLRAQHPHLCRS
jgi:hydroxymethylbilane synthase